MKTAKLWILLAVMMVGSVAALGQTNVNEEQGLKPFDSYHGGDLDSVSMTNGGLVIHIPLVSFPQRGNLDLSFSIYASSKQWRTRVNSVECANPSDPNGCTPVWIPIVRGSFQPQFGGVPVQGAYVASSLDWLPDNECNTTTGNPDNGIPPSFNWSASVTAPDGNVHSFGSGTSTSFCPAPPFRALDASGIYQLDANTIVMPNGTRFNFPANGTPNFVDANGNTISISPNSYTDTLGRVIALPPASTTPDVTNCPAGSVASKVWTVPGLAGGTRTFTFCYSNKTIFTNFAFGGTNYPAASTPLLTAIVLPDSTKWTFDYDHFGDITYLGFPTGGSITYAYVVGPVTCGDDTPLSMVVQSRTVNANDGSGDHKWTYSYAPPTMVVTSPAPDFNDTVHTIGDPITGQVGCSMVDTQVQYYQGPRSGGAQALLKTESTQYSANPNTLTIPGSGATVINVIPKQKTVITRDGHTSKTVNTWDSGNAEAPYGTAVPVVFGSLVQRDEYDFSGNLVRSTRNRFTWQDFPAHLANNLISLPEWSTVYNGSAPASNTSTPPLCNAGGTPACVSQTKYGYDEGSVTPSGIGAPTLVAPPAGEPYRGNLTTVSHWLDTAKSFISNTATYFDSGMKASSTDPLGHATSYSYSSTFLGAYMTQTNLPDTQMPDTGAAIVHHVIKGDYDLNTGVLTKFVDENGQLYTYAYDSLTLRLKEADHPDLGWTKFFYPDPNTVERQRLIGGTTHDDFQVKFDGVGRPYQTIQATPDCTSGGGIKVDTTYDSLGRTRTVSNPYCLTSEPTYGTTTSDYDALGRIIKTTKQDKSFTTVKYEDIPVDTSNTSTVCTTVRDEAGKPRQSCNDAFGRLVEVVEPNAAAPGTSPTASVTIGGQLTDAVITGGAAHTAAAGSPLSSVVMPDGSAQTFYFDGNHHLNRFYWNSASGWISEDITAITGNTVAGAGSGLTSAVMNDGSVHVFYLGANQHVYDLNWNGAAGWGNKDLTAINAGSGLAAAGSKLSALAPPSGPIPIAVYYEAVNQHIYQWYWSSSAGWQNQDLTLTTGNGSITAAAGSAITSGIMNDGSTQVFYVGPNQHVYQLACCNPGWNNYDVTSFVPGSLLAAGGSSLTMLTPAAGAAIPLIVVYEGTNQHIDQLYWSPSAGWQNQDLSASTGTTTAAVGSALTSTIVSGSWFVSYTGAANQHVYVLSCCGPAWANTDLNVAAGSTVAAGAGSGQSSVGAANNLFMHEFYIGGNGHVYDLFYNAGVPAWQSADLNATTKNSQLDSGIVTLNVGGFNATACFGPSTNSSCTAQQQDYSASDVAGALAAAINVAGSPATATVSGSTINLVWKAQGNMTPPIGVLSTTHDNSTLFQNPSFTSPDTSFGGGQGAVFSSTSYITKYQYNTRGDMLRVDQLGSAPADSTQWRTRQFTYDSLSRLLTAMNPELNSTGSTVITYGYDNDSRLTSKIEPAPNAPWGTSSTVTVKYTYDALNRLLDTTFSDGTTPKSSHRYDYASFQGQTFNNPIGREVAAFTVNASGSTVASAFISYDPMGRVAAATQCHPGVTGCKTFSAGYDQLGDLKTLAYPGNSFSVTYGVDSAARLTSATDSNGVIYAQTPTYVAGGLVKEFTSPNFNNNKYHVDYNSRLQPVEIWTGSAQGTAALFDKQYQYNPLGVTQVNNGNIFTITNVKDTKRSQSFTYDALNRLLTAGDNVNWANSYTYDAWGNHTNRTPGSPTGELLNKAADANNHLSGLTYDAAGNVINDGSGGTFVYDGENRIVKAGGVTYTYDADGRRIQKSTGINYWYGPGGQALAETDSAGNWTNYIFTGSQRLARNVSGDIKYYITDHLHSTAMFVDKAGTPAAILDDNDMYPWGGVVPGVGKTTSNNTIKFTGQYRDTDTAANLDYFGARYYSNTIGRFMSPDWAAAPVTVPYAKFGDPQSLNLYSYVENGPVNRADADGHSYENNRHMGEGPTFDNPDPRSSVPAPEAVRAEIEQGVAYAKQQAEEMQRWVEEHPDPNQRHICGPTCTGDEKEPEHKEQTPGDEVKALGKMIATVMDPIAKAIEETANSLGDDLNKAGVTWEKLNNYGKPFAMAGVAYGKAYADIGIGIGHLYTNSGLGIAHIYTNLGIAIKNGIQNFDNKVVQWLGKIEDRWKVGPMGLN